MVRWKFVEPNFSEHAQYTWTERAFILVQPKRFKIYFQLISIDLRKIQETHQFNKANSFVAGIRTLNLHVSLFCFLYVFFIKFDFYIVEMKWLGWSHFQENTEQKTVTILSHCTKGSMKILYHLNVWCVLHKWEVELENSNENSFKSKDKMKSKQKICHILNSSSIN